MRLLAGVHGLPAESILPRIGIVSQAADIVPGRP
jgi:hypothetical protein